VEDFMSKIWLITGSASGLGRNIAEAVLASGDRLVAFLYTNNRMKCPKDRVTVIAGRNRIRDRDFRLTPQMRGNGS
jgi:NAD(P)-dependent dehydrogenase (short-subunit alcohol dehydrogenase family)